MEQDLSLLLDLAPLTGLRLGIAAQPGQVVGGLKFRFATPPPRLGGRKLLSFIPSRYGQVSSLSCAADCVVAKLRQMIQRRPTGKQPPSSATPEQSELFRPPLLMTRSERRLRPCVRQSS